MPSRYVILIIAVLIVSLGIISIYSSTYQRQTQVWKQQVFRALLGIGVFLVFSYVNYRRLWDIATFFFVVAVILLCFVFVLGVIRLGAQRWLQFVGFNLQPSEVMKLAVIIFLARYFSRRSVSTSSLGSRQLGIVDGLIIPLAFIAIPMFLIIEQPDLGSALMLLFIFLAMLFLTNIRGIYLGIFVGLCAAIAPFFWHFLKGYQKDRLMVFLNPNIDPLGAGYTLIQSKIAMGSGGLFGKGWLSGTQSQLRFLPESHTDFIFATFAEEWGFVGGGFVLVLYYLLIRESFRIAARTHDHFGKLLAFGISLSISIQAFINIAMTMGLMPIVGLPLPLMSYGGSSIVVTFAALGILANIDRTRSIF
ncbi:MAG: rod shape-determining protein RodA [Candidatus Omnitrophica bacterium]|nr:rod shape-determining protein RodA [Candidatus Omnitrophota bacterium]